MIQLSVSITIISSLLSGLIGVGVSILVFYKLERHKLKLDLARRLLGYRFDIKGDDFSCAMNEVIAVFAKGEGGQVFTGCCPNNLLKNAFLYPNP